MAMSMTGYGRESLHLHDATIIIEIRSVNHRFLDISTRLPSALVQHEDTFKKIIQSYMQRGRVELSINIIGNAFVKRGLAVDWDLLDELVEQVKQMKKRYHLVGDIPVTIISSIPEIVSIQEHENRTTDMEHAIIDGIHNACRRVVTMRQEEGQHLLKDVEKHITLIQQLLTRLESRRESVIEEYRERIENRIAHYLAGHKEIDHTRLHQEVALLVEKGDITEELTRLSSHIDHFLTTILEQGTMGRKLEFITQEMHREANTIGSKAMDTKVNKWTINLKSHIEKIKEQVQNIE